MNVRYKNHPYFIARLAVCMDALKATATCARLLRQVNLPIPIPGFI
jgi:hypothetical protein